MPTRYRSMKRPGSLSPSAGMSVKPAPPRTISPRQDVQLPLEKGDALFFNPALFHAAGSSRTTSVQRMANLLQISSAYGRAMESLNRTKMGEALYPVLLKRGHMASITPEDADAVIASCAEGYPFPMNLDRDSQQGGLAPPSQCWSRRLHDSNVFVRTQHLTLPPSPRCRQQRRKAPPSGRFGPIFSVGMDVAFSEAFEEKVMTCRYSDAAETKSVGTNAIVAVAAVALVAVCLTGIAAFAGLLPNSDRVAAAMTATPLVDMQVDVRRNDPDPRLEPQLEDGEPGASTN